MRRNVGGADHKAVIFSEAVTYAAADAYQQVTGGSLDDYYQQLAQRSPQEDVPYVEPDMGEDFDFDSNVEMHRRLPRLATLYGLPTDDA